jgi:hypothetical protein
MANREHARTGKFGHIEALEILHNSTSITGQKSSNVKLLLLPSLAVDTQSRGKWGSHFSWMEKPFFRPEQQP